MATLIAFDLDGVLYSSEPFLGDAYRDAIVNVNARRPGSFARVPSTAEILRHVGWPVPVILARLFPAVDPAAVTMLEAETLDTICARVARREGRLFDDVPATLTALHDAGHLLAVASNGRSRYVETVLATYDLTHLFVDRLSPTEPDRKLALLRGYLARHEIRPAGAVMIGDRASDVDAARTAGVPFIGCDYGHGHRDEIAAAGPVVSRFGDLPAAIAALLMTPAQPPNKIK